MGRDTRVRDDASDAELLAACGEDPEAFGIFYRRHVAAVLAHLGSTDLAADVCAETFARALERAALFDPRRDPPRAWLLTMASAILADGVRRGGEIETRARQRLGMPHRDGERTRAGLERDLVAAASRRRDARRAALALRLRRRA